MSAGNTKTTTRKAYSNRKQSKSSDISTTSLREMMLREMRLLAHLWTVQSERNVPVVRWMSSQERCVDTGNSGLLLRSSPQIVISIDEVGRGCFAGDVTVAATVWRLQQSFDTPESHVAMRNIAARTRDSKKMSSIKRSSVFDDASALLGTDRLIGFLRNEGIIRAPSCRTNQEFWHANYGGAPRAAGPILQFEPFADVKNHIELPDYIQKWHESQEESYCHLRECAFIDPESGDLCELSEGALAIKGCIVGKASPNEIDALGIVQAIWLATSRALSQVARLTGAKSSFHPSQVLCLFDGSEPLNLETSWSDAFQMTLVGGDDALKSIGLASVLAKVERDTLMSTLPEASLYGWTSGKGYGTADHIRAIAEHGVCTHHRRSFIHSHRSPATPASFDEIAIENKIRNDGLKCVAERVFLPREDIASTLFQPRKISR